MRALLAVCCLVTIAGCGGSDDDERCPTTPGDTDPTGTVGDTAPTDTDTPPIDTDTTDTDTTDPTTEPAPLDPEELAGLDTWVPHSVSMTPQGGRYPVTGDRLSILLEDVSHELQIVSGTKAQDHNSSRSNKTASVAASDPLDDGTGTGLVVVWDGRAACATLPCESDGRAVGASSLATLDLGTALDDGVFSLSWAETYPMSATWTGALSVEMVDYRGHVTVLKASSTPGGDVVITSALTAEELSVTDGGAPVYTGRPTGCDSPLAVLAGTTGANWPTGIAVESTPIGTRVSFTW